jgi:ammonia channel protein AmtB
MAKEKTYWRAWEAMPPGLIVITAAVGTVVGAVIGGIVTIAVVIFFYGYLAAEDKGGDSNLEKFLGCWAATDW